MQRPNICCAGTHLALQHQEAVVVLSFCSFHHLDIFLHGHRRRGEVGWVCSMGDIGRLTQHAAPVPGPGQSARCCLPQTIRNACPSLAVRRCLRNPERCPFFWAMILNAVFHLGDVGGLARPVAGVHQHMVEGLVAAACATEGHVRLWSWESGWTLEGGGGW